MGDCCLPMSQEQWPPWALSMYSLMGRGLQIGVIFRSVQQKACYDDLAFTCGTLRGAGDRLDRAGCS